MSLYKLDEQLTYENGFEHGYNQAITEMLETDKHDELSQRIALNVFDRGVAKGRAGAIEKIITNTRERKRDAYQYLNSDYASGFLSALLMVEEIADELKEHKNE